MSNEHVQLKYVEGTHNEVSCLFWLGISCVARIVVISAKESSCGDKKHVKI